MYAHDDGSDARIPIGPIGQFQIGLIASERRPYVTNSVIGDANIRDQEWAKREGLVAFAGYPLLIEDNLVGVMAIFARKEFARSTLGAIGSVAKSIAAGIERKRGEEQFRLVVGSAPNGMLMIDRTGAIVLV